MAVEIIIADVFDALAKMADESVHCVVTSPPYWGLRDYGVDGQLGLEPTLGEHLDVMVRLFGEVRRVLRKDGTLWLNYGDCYAASPNGRSAAATKAAGKDDRTFRDKPFSTIGGVLKAKDLCMIPNRLAIALQEAGWWVRSEIVWFKPNPMPESTRDRPTSAHEKIFLLTKSARYFYDAEAVREIAQKVGTPAHLSGGANGRENVRRTPGSSIAQYRPALTWDERKSRGESSRRGDPSLTGWATPGGNVGVGGMGRNMRNVWEIATSSFPEAHFATFPPALAERCIKAGCPAGGTVLDPFGGSGTTGLVADRLGRNAILIELNPDYAAMARRRIDADVPLLATPAPAAAPEPAQIDMEGLAA